MGREFCEYIWIRNSVSTIGQAWYFVQVRGRLDFLCDSAGGCICDEIKLESVEVLLIGNIALLKIGVEGEREASTKNYH